MKVTNWQIQTRINKISASLLEVGNEIPVSLKSVAIAMTPVWSRSYLGISVFYAHTHRTSVGALPWNNFLLTD